MADIELVIKIPEELYNECKRLGDKRDTLFEAIRNGTPLPKGHGRLLDEKEILNTNANDGGWYDLVDMPEYIAGVPAIIEADNKENKE